MSESSRSGGFRTRRPRCGDPTALPEREGVEILGNMRETRRVGQNEYRSVQSP